jgi:hypothetical protein
LPRWTIKSLDGLVALLNERVICGPAENPFVGSPVRLNASLPKPEAAILVS